MRRISGVSHGKGAASAAALSLALLGSLTGPARADEAQARGLLAAEDQVHGQSDVAPIQLRGLEETFRAVHRIGRQTNQEVRSFQQVKVAVHRGLFQR